LEGSGLGTTPEAAEATAADWARMAFSMVSNLSACEDEVNEH